tara:strand:- start:44 stop:538 length:495 start_codon:yes stop_codon:yes gene_type:complete
MFKIIKEFPKYEINENGIVRNIKTGRIMKTCIHTSNITSYQHKILGLRKDKKRSTQKLHRLLAETFIPNPDNLPDVDHSDNNSLNNTLTNLRWSSKSENQRNRRVQKNNKLGIKNICYDKVKNRYKFKKTVKGKLIEKSFKTLDEAIECKDNWYNNNFSEYNRK